MKNENTKWAEQYDSPVCCKLSFDCECLLCQSMASTTEDFNMDDKPFEW